MYNGSEIVRQFTMSAIATIIMISYINMKLQNTYVHMYVLSVKYMCMLSMCVKSQIRQFCSYSL